MTKEDGKAMEHKDQNQHVCLVCGYNMVGYLPDCCPFCGASCSQFITATECSNRFKVIATPVNDTVTRLSSVPPLGLEHAAYRIKTDTRVVWIDCPSTFDPTLETPHTITFTHHHFLGASNLYKESRVSRLSIHRQDSTFDLCRGYSFDKLFEDDHEISGIQAYHIAGHTPGFTCYIYEETLFICDYVFYDTETMIYNPYGLRNKTEDGGRKLMEIIRKKQLTKVCGYNYVADFADWIEQFNKLLLK